MLNIIQADLPGLGHVVGDQDEIWPADMTPRLAQRLRDAGRSPEVHVYEGQPHMPAPSGWDAHLGLLLDFFSRNLRP